MADDAEINVKITSDSSQAKKDVEQTGAAVETFGQRFRATFSAVLSADLVQKVAKAVFDFGKSSVEAYENAQNVQTTFVDAMRRIPDASDATTKSLQDQATALAQVTTFSASQTKQAQATLAGFGLTGKQIKTLTPLVQDMASKLGEDVPTAASAVGKALLGSGRGLKGLGVDFADTGTLGGNFAEIAGDLQTKVGGLSKEMGETSAGKMKIMENQVGALKVALGSGLVPVIEAVLPVLRPLMTFIAANAKWMTPLAVGIIAVAGAFIFLNFAVGLFMANPPVLLLLGIAAAVVAVVVVIILLVKYWHDIWDAIKKGAAEIWAIMQQVWDDILGVIQVVWNWIKANWPLLLGILLGPIALAAALIYTYWQYIWDGLLVVWGWIQTAWNAVYGFLIAPIVTAVVAIAGFIGRIPGYFSAALGWVAGVWSTVYNAVTTPILNAANWIWGKIQAIGGWFSSVASSIAGALSGVFNAIIGPFKQAWDWINTNVIGPIKGAWNGVAHALNAVHIDVHIPSNPITDFLHIAGLGFSWDPPKIPTLARGGLITQTGFVFAHAGEAISPIPGRAAGRSGPVVEIAHAHFSEKIDVATFGRRLAWEMKVAGV